jgi:predicted SprT family Zn-dependent metalloprotease|tara:strand:- start:8907 stop:9413 length:507 start_codon:yes stop_codon:yes gene_type:complete
MNNTRKQNLESLAKNLLEEWGLKSKGWTFCWNSRKRSFGVCSPRLKTIALSDYLLPTINNDSAEDTIRHELAHALDVEERGTSDHSWKWKQWAIKVGADPTRTKSHDNTEASEELASQSKYTLVCKKGHKSPSHKKRKRSVSCSRCNKEAGLPSAYYEKFKMEQIRNY